MLKLYTNNYKTKFKEINRKYTRACYQITCKFMENCQCAHNENIQAAPVCLILDKTRRIWITTSFIKLLCTNRIIKKNTHTHTHNHVRETFWRAREHFSFFTFENLILWWCWYIISIGNVLNLFTYTNFICL